MNESYRLAVLREQSSIGDIDELQLLRIVGDLHWNRVDVLRSTQQQVHGKGRTRLYVDAGRIETERGATRSGI